MTAICAGIENICNDCTCAGTFKGADRALPKDQTLPFAAMVERSPFVTQNNDKRGRGWGGGGEGGREKESC